nr:MAG TPA: hypothetical protein [Caudoviricetes sp.]DAO24913.1 MAG TPA: hypothetical protein [Caudoviricetes sp.]
MFSYIGKCANLSHSPTTPRKVRKYAWFSCGTFVPHCPPRPT